MIGKKKKSKLELAQEEAEAAVNRTNRIIEELGNNTSRIYDQLDSLQSKIDEIRGIPDDTRIKYEQLKKIRLNWKQQAEQIELDYKNAATKNAGKGAAGVGAGIAVAALGPTAAMGIATTFGVASTGTAIAALHGAAATSAALAWLGGGALAAGGGGMAAGQALLAMAGPVGWAIAGGALAVSGLMLWKGSTDKSHLEDIFTLISERDVKSYDFAVVELNERIARIKDESNKLKEVLIRIYSFGLDYNSMTDMQQYELGSYVNLMNASTQLLVNPILGLQPKYIEADLQRDLPYKAAQYSQNQKNVIISLANLLYKIPLTEQDFDLLWKNLRGNKEFLKSFGLSKKDLDHSIIEIVKEALSYKYKNDHS
jgi:hypothetical protein